MRSPEQRDLERKLLDSLSDVVAGTAYAPPAGGVLVDVLVVMIHVDGDGDHGSSWLSSGSAEQAEGMARRVVRSVESAINDD